MNDTKKSFVLFSSSFSFLEWLKTAPSQNYPKEFWKVKKKI
jgi:hypothetical protein